MQKYTKYHNNSQPIANSEMRHMKEPTGGSRSSSRTTVRKMKMNKNNTQIKKEAENNQGKKQIQKKKRRQKHQRESEIAIGCCCCCVPFFLFFNRNAFSHSSTKYLSGVFRPSNFDIFSVCKSANSMPYGPNSAKFKQIGQITKANECNWAD